MSNPWDWTQAPIGHWQAFRNAPSTFKFDKILDRNQLPLPNWFVSPAHGVLVPSQYYLSQRGYDPRTFQSRGWIGLKRVDGYYRNVRAHRYLSRRCGDVFSVERSWDGRVYFYGSVLAHRFASTPIFTRTLEEAQYLAQLKEPPSDLRWVTLLSRDPNTYNVHDYYHSVFSKKLTR